MTPEEYQRLKEAEKEHLRKLKKLKEAVRQLERQKRVSRAVEDITDGPRALMDENADLVDQLAMETARSEAKLEIALESAAEKGETRPDPADEARMDEELRRLRARQLVEQMRGESSAPEPKTTTDAKKEAKDDESKPRLPEKTIGRMKP